MKLANTIPTEDEALLPRKASSPWRGLVVRAAAVSLALGLVASAVSFHDDTLVPNEFATGGVSTTSLSSKTHAGKFESPKGGKFGNIKVKGGGSFSDQAGHFGSSWPGGGERPPIRYEDSPGVLRGPSDTQLLIYSYIKR